jgi:hypothetical protein
VKCIEPAKYRVHWWSFVKLEQTSGYLKLEKWTAQGSQCHEISISKTLISTTWTLLSFLFSRTHISLEYAQILEQKSWIIFNVLRTIFILLKRKNLSISYFRLNGFWTLTFKIWQIRDGTNVFVLQVATLEGWHELDFVAAWFVSFVLVIGTQFSFDRSTENKH